MGCGAHELRAGMLNISEIISFTADIILYYNSTCCSDLPPCMFNVCVEKVILKIMYLIALMCPLDEMVNCHTSAN